MKTVSDNGWLAIATLALFCITAAGAIAATWRTSRSRATIETLKQAADAYRLQAEAQQSVIERQSQERADLERQVSDLRGRIAVLQDMVTSKSAIDRLSAVLEAFIGQSSGMLTEILSHAAKTDAALAKLAAGK